MITIELKYDEAQDEYLPGRSKDGLCGDGLNRYFNLNHRPKVIWLELRDAATKESVPIRLRDGHAAGRYILRAVRAYAARKGVDWNRTYHVSVLEQVT